MVTCILARCEYIVLARCLTGQLAPLAWPLLGFQLATLCEISFLVEVIENFRIDVNLTKTWFPRFLRQCIKAGLSFLEVWGNVTVTQ